MMNDIISVIAISCALIPFIITLLLFAYFGYHKKDYDALLAAHHQKGFILNAPYNFYSWMGFFGSFGMAYYFSRLKSNKKIVFAPENSNSISNFLSELNPADTHWLDIYYKLSFIALSLYLFFIFLSLIKLFLTC